MYQDNRNHVSVWEPLQGSSESPTCHNYRKTEKPSEKDERGWLWLLFLEEVTEKREKPGVRQCMLVHPLASWVIESCLHDDIFVTLGVPKSPKSPQSWPNSLVFLRKNSEAEIHAQVFRDCVCYRESVFGITYKVLLIFPNALTNSLV